jgi:hypothetical protein
MEALESLLDAGLAISTEGSRLCVSPSSLITEELRHLIRTHRGELWQAVKDAEFQLHTLICCINLACDARGDDERNRAALMTEAASLTAKESADMCQHFMQQVRLYPHFIAEREMEDKALRSRGCNDPRCRLGTPMDECCEQCPRCGRLWSAT